MARIPEPDSTELALKAQRGDRTAFAALYDRHAPGIARALASFVGPRRDLIDDLVQDVFLRVIERLSTYEPTRPFEGWLFTVALNVGRNHARIRLRWRETSLDGARVEAALSGFTEDDLTVMDLVRSVAELPPELREVVALRIGSDFSFEQIAELLSIPTGTARRRMHTATQRLRQKMDDGLSEKRSSHERT